MPPDFRYLTLKDISDYEGKRPNRVLIRKPEWPSSAKIVVLVYGNRRYYCEQLNKKVPLLANHFSGLLRGSAL